MRQKDESIIHKCHWHLSFLFRPISTHQLDSDWWRAIKVIFWSLLSVKYEMVINVSQFGMSFLVSKNPTIMIWNKNLKLHQLFWLFIGKIWVEFPIDQVCDRWSDEVGNYLIRGLCALSHLDQVLVEYCIGEYITKDGQLHLKPALGQNTDYMEKYNIAPLFGAYLCLLDDGINLFFCN